MATPAAVRVWGNSFALYRRIWRSNLLGSFLQPMLYLLGMGIGVGALVDSGPGSADVLDGVSYFAFLAPALIATSVMMTVTSEAMWPVMDGFTWSFQYRAMAATPLAPADIANGVALWHATRATITAAGVAGVLVLFDDTRSWGLLAAIPFAVLCGAAFSLPVSAWSSSRVQSDQSFPAIQRFVIVPMFLFAGAFYPIDQLPSWLEAIARITPLWHGVELCRGAVLGTLGVAEAAVHVAVLLTYALAGWLICRRNFRMRLAT
jgi:lipooligosaccharide transport system permease protein